MAHIMTTKELSPYLKPHEITFCKHAPQGPIPGIRIGHVWRFEKDVIHEWTRAGQSWKEIEDPRRKTAREESGTKNQGHESQHSFG